MLGLAQLFGTRVLEVERALLRLNLVLVVDCLEDTGAKLSSHLSEHTVSLQRLDDHVLKFVHLCLQFFLLQLTHALSVIMMSLKFEFNLNY